MQWIIGIGIFLFACLLLKLGSTKYRRVRLMAKYHDAQIVDRLIRHKFWEGQTQEQVVDALGQPTDIDQEVLKTKKREIWKYNQTGKNRFKLRLTIENGTVVGWDKKE